MRLNAIHKTSRNIINSVYYVCLYLDVSSTNHYGSNLAFWGSVGMGTICMSMHSHCIQKYLCMLHVICVNNWYHSNVSFISVLIMSLCHCSEWTCEQVLSLFHETLVSDILL